MTGLLDVNVLVALAWPNHVHHHAAQGWFRANAEDWATTPVTESGFVRVSANRRALPSAVRPADALALLAAIRALPGHRFLPDDVPGVAGDQGLDTRLIVTHHLVTDAHLVAVARRHRARLVTFDRRLPGLVPDRPEDVLVLSGAGG